MPALSEREQFTPARQLTEVRVDHRIPARQVEAMILDVFDVPSSKRYEVVRLALKISKANADYFFGITHLFKDEPQGRA